MPLPVALSSIFPESEPPNPEKLVVKLVCAGELKIYALKKINSTNDFIESAVSVYYRRPINRMTLTRKRKKQGVRARHDETGRKKQMS
jgi:hypothetical protein